PTGDVAYALGQTHVPGRHRTGPAAVSLDEQVVLDEVADHFGDEARIAFGLLHKQARERDAFVLELGTTRCGEQRLHALLIETVEIDALDTASAPQVGKYSRERMPAVDVGVAVGHDNQHGRLGREVRDSVAEELNAARIGP